MDFKYGRYCGEHPLTKREILPNGMIGLPISGINCQYRTFNPWINYWQSHCSRQDRINQGCEK